MSKKPGNSVLITVGRRRRRRNVGFHTVLPYDWLPVSAAGREGDYETGDKREPWWEGPDCLPSQLVSDYEPVLHSPLTPANYQSHGVGPANMIFQVLYYVNRVFTFSPPTTEIVNTELFNFIVLVFKL